MYFLASVYLMLIFSFLIRLFLAHNGFDNCRRKLALLGKGTQLDGLRMGRCGKREPDRRSEILLLKLVQIAEFDCRPQSNAAFINHSEEVWDEFCESDVT